MILQQQQGIGVTRARTIRPTTPVRQPSSDFKAVDVAKSRAGRIIIIIIIIVPVFKRRSFVTYSNGQEVAVNALRSHAANTRAPDLTSVSMTV
jgi:hypothetical protein